METQPLASPEALEKLEEVYGQSKPQASKPLNVDEVKPSKNWLSLDEPALPMIDHNLREGARVGILGIYNKEYVLQSVAYKVQRVRPNGTVVLKPQGRIQ